MPEKYEDWPEEWKTTSNPMPLSWYEALTIQQELIGVPALNFVDCGDIINV